MNMIKELLRHPAFQEASDAYKTIIENQERIEKKLDILCRPKEEDKSETGLLVENSLCDNTSCEMQYVGLSEDMYQIQLRLNTLENERIMRLDSTYRKRVNQIGGFLKANHMIFAASLLAVATVVGIAILFSINL